MRSDQEFLKLTNQAENEEFIIFSDKILLMRDSSKEWRQMHLIASSTNIYLYHIEKRNLKRSIQYQ
jgi:hypothetical protein